VKRNTLVTVCIVLLVASAFLAGCGGQAQPKKMTIATASMGGAYYPIGTGIAEIVSKNVKGVTMTAEVTGGAVENCRLVGKKETDLGITNANLAYFASRGEDAYKEKHDLRALGSLHSTILHIITLDKSPIRTIADMKGKKVAVGPAGGGSIPMIKAVLDVYGMKIEDLQASYVSYEDGMMALKDGNVDVALAAAGYPTSAVMQLANTDKIRLVEIEPDKMKALIEKYPYYSKVVVPASVYKLEKDAVVQGVANTLIVNASMDEKTAYEITKAIYNNLEQLGSFHASIKQVKIETAFETPIQLHPGAKKYWTEKGLVK
jgi:TRAP transporter TAXI family solute receptor